MTLRESFIATYDKLIEVQKKLICSRGVTAGSVVIKSLINKMAVLSDADLERAITVVDYWRLRLEAAAESHYNKRHAWCKSFQFAANGITNSSLPTKVLCNERLIATAVTRI